MNADVLLSRLDGVIDRGGRSWYAKCPAHADKVPSLSITDKGDRLLLHCFAGCSADDVLQAVGLKWTDLYPDRWHAAYRSAVSSTGGRLARDLDPMDVDLLILKIAEARLARGDTLTLEDTARLDLATQRVRARLRRRRDG